MNVSIVNQTKRKLENTEQMSLSIAQKAAIAQHYITHYKTAAQKEELAHLTDHQIFKLAQKKVAQNAWYGMDAEVMLGVFAVSIVLAPVTLGVVVGRQIYYVVQMNQVMDAYEYYRDLAFADLGDQLDAATLAQVRIYEDDTVSFVNGLESVLFHRGYKRIFDLPDPIVAPVPATPTIPTTAPGETDAQPT
jgi:hypothetical protein